MNRISNMSALNQIKRRISLSVANGENIIITRMGEDCNDKLSLSEFSNIIDGLQFIKILDNGYLLQEDCDYMIKVTIK